jgi:hypothetical protein
MAQVDSFEIRKKGRDASRWHASIEFGCLYEAARNLRLQVQTTGSRLHKNRKVPGRLLRSARQFSRALRVSVSADRVDDNGSCSSSIFTFRNSVQFAFSGSLAIENVPSR